MNEDGALIASSTPRPRPSVVLHKYFGPHPVPPQNGGGWDATEGSHTHVYEPFEPALFRQLSGEWVYSGPTPTPTPDQ